MSLLQHRNKTFSPFSGHLTLFHAQFHNADIQRLCENISMLFYNLTGQLL